jgi:pyrroline-5-carboxylate reductase
MRVAILGLGRMGSALERGFRADPRVRRVGGTRSGDDNVAAVRDADVVVVAVKPRHVRALLAQVGPHLARALLVSICAGIRIEDLTAWSGGHRRVVRAMPNTPASVGAGISVLAGAPGLASGDLEIARSLFATVGATEIIDEALFDAVTGLSGCGPAYVFSVIAALADGGAALGIPPAAALRLAAQTVLGSAKLLLERQADPATLRDEVATPGGATVEGLRALREAGIDRAFAEAVAAGARRSAELRTQE